MCFISRSSLVCCFRICRHLFLHAKSLILVTVIIYLFTSPLFLFIACCFNCCACCSLVIACSLVHCMLCYLFHLLLFLLLFVVDCLFVFSSAIACLCTLTSQARCKERSHSRIISSQLFLGGSTSCTSKSLGSWMGFRPTWPSPDGRDRGTQCPWRLPKFLVCGPCNC